MPFIKTMIVGDDAFLPLTEDWLAYLGVQIGDALNVIETANGIMLTPSKHLKDTKTVK